MSLLECTVQNFVVHAYAAVRPLGVVVTDPGARDVIELVPTEAHEVVEAFPFDGADERLRECVGLRSLDWTAEPFGTVRAPKFPKGL